MATYLKPLSNEDDSMILFSPSNSPEYSTSPSSSLYHSPPPSFRFEYKLSIKNLSYTLHPHNSTTFPFCQKPKPITILKSVSFLARSFEIVAVVGPSATGKSTLLRVIAGRVKYNDFNFNCISIIEQPMTSPAQLRKICGFVAQEDNLLPLLTVKETLLVCAKFRLKDMIPKDREPRVESLMQELGFFYAVDTFVGDKENRGIFGGERKRVSIGVDMIHNPPILLLDELTSGLDSTSAFHVIELPSSMVKAKLRTVILSIHQPSYRVLHYISKFLILSHGSVVHNGRLQSLEEAISNLGFQIPVQLNALEFSMEIICRLEESNSKCETSSNIDKKEPFPNPMWPEEENKGVQSNCKRENFSSFFYANLIEILFLSSRFWKINYRTKQIFSARTMQALVGGFGLGSVYIKVRNNEGVIGCRK